MLWDDIHREEFSNVCAAQRASADRAVVVVDDDDSEDDDDDDEILTRLQRRELVCHF